MEMYEIMKSDDLIFSGVATFCKTEPSHSNSSENFPPNVVPDNQNRNLSVPLRADEGITGILHFNSDQKLEDEKFRVGGYDDVFRFSKSRGLSSQDLEEIDGEGRCLITDHGAFGTIINFLFQSETQIICRVLKFYHSISPS